MKCIGVHTTGKYFTGCGRYSIVSTCQTSDRVKEDHYVVSAFYQSFCFLEYDTCDFYVAFCRFVKSRSDYFCVDAACHVGYFLRTFVDQQHNHIYCRMIGCDGVGDIFHQDGLTCLRLCYDQCTLSLTDRSEKVYNPGRHGV